MATAYTSAMANNDESCVSWGTVVPNTQSFSSSKKIIVTTPVTVTCNSTHNENYKFWVLLHEVHSDMVDTTASQQGGFHYEDGPFSANLSTIATRTETQTLNVSAFETLPVADAFYIIYVNQPSSSNNLIASSEIFSLLSKRELDTGTNTINTHTPLAQSHESAQLRLQLLNNNSSDLPAAAAAATAPSSFSITITTSYTTVPSTEIETITASETSTITSTSCTCDASSFSSPSPSSSKARSPSTWQTRTRTRTRTKATTSAITEYPSGIMTTVTVPGVSGTDTYTYSLVPPSSSAPASFSASPPPRPAPPSTEELTLTITATASGDNGVLPITTGSPSLPSSFPGGAGTTTTASTGTGAVQPTSTTTQPEIYPPSSPNPLTGGQIAGVVIAAVIFVAVLMLGCWYLAGALEQFRRRWLGQRELSGGQAGAGGAGGVVSGGEGIELTRFGGAGAGTGTGTEGGDGAGVETSRGNFVV